uniref:Uncharacterized protein n=1 Tax=Parascaris univalens TaxID=6257 RepID=A0A915C9H9_PARUN
MNIVALSMLYFTLASSAKVEIPALMSYRQRIEEMRRLVNKPKFAHKTKRYKCIEIDDNELDVNNRLWSIGEASLTQSQLMLQMEHTDASDSTPPHIMPATLASLNQKSINTSTRQPVIIELPRRISATPQGRPQSDLHVEQIGNITNMRQSYAIPQVPNLQRSRHLPSQPLIPTAVENVQQLYVKSASTLPPQQCAQVIFEVHFNKVLNNSN